MPDVPTSTKLPSGWIMRSKGLREFMVVPDLRVNVAALKLYLCLLAHAEQTSDHGIVQISYDDLSDCTGTPRILIKPGMERLNNLVNTTSGRGRHASNYRVLDYPQPGQRGYAQVPAKHLVEKQVLCSFDGTNKSHLQALKLYLLFLAARKNIENYALFGYTKIEEYTRVRRNDIYRATTLLVNADLIHPHYGDDVRVRGVFAHTGNMDNTKRYEIIGLGRTTPQKNPGAVLWKRDLSDGITDH